MSAERKLSPEEKRWLDQVGRAEERLDHIQEVVDKAPPLSGEQKANLRLLLGGGRDST